MFRFIYNVLLAVSLEGRGPYHIGDRQAALLVLVPAAVTFVTVFAIVLSLGLVAGAGMFLLSLFLWFILGAFWYGILEEELVTKSPYSYAEVPVTVFCTLCVPLTFILATSYMFYSLTFRPAYWLGTKVFSLSARMGSKVQSDA